MARPLKVKKISRFDPIDRTARRILRTRLKEYYSHWPNPDTTVTWEQLHNLRISGKRLRYSAEMLREFYPDRLTLLIDLLKHSQELLGEIQDCVTQRMMIEEDLARMKRRKAENPDLAVLERISAEYDQRQVQMFNQFREHWRGMARNELRDCLKVMVAEPLSAKTRIKASRIQAEPELMFDLY